MIGKRGEYEVREKLGERQQSRVTRGMRERRNEMKYEKDTENNSRK
jgi:hypothetical protein